MTAETAPTVDLVKGAPCSERTTSAPDMASGGAHLLPKMELNPFGLAQQQFDEVAEQLGLSGEIRDMLRWPVMEIHFRIPVRMDDGSLRCPAGVAHKGGN